MHDKMQRISLIIFWLVWGAYNAMFAYMVAKWVAINQSWVDEPPDHCVEIYYKRHENGMVEECRRDQRELIVQRQTSSPSIDKKQKINIQRRGLRSAAYGVSFGAGSAASPMCQSTT